MMTRKSDNATHNDFTIALAGNPNVGKSSIFNRLTHLNQHTGNWAGKTVEICQGKYEQNNRTYKIIDLPGSYSLFHNSEEEQITDEFIISKNYNCIVIVMDSTSLERNMLLAIQILSKTTNAIICLNMDDEAKRKGIYIDTDELSLQLGIPVIKTSVRHAHTLDNLKVLIEEVSSGKRKTYPQNRFIDTESISDPYYKAKKITKLSSDICKQVIKSKGSSYTHKDKKLDYLFTSKSTGIPIMILLFGLIFWITAIGANYPSEWLSRTLFTLKDYLNIGLIKLNIHSGIISFLLDGIYTSVCWVLSVMLPPAMIFFPLFAIVEDFGYLPRVVFNLDRFFSKAGTTGKQALTMSLGFGCNACGVTGCRIMSSRKEKILSSITNSFIPCNGRLPTLIAIISIFFASALSGAQSSIVAAGILLIILTFCVMISIGVTSILNKIIKSNESSTLTLELPPFRKPQIIRSTLVSVKDKVLYVTSRAIIMAAPCGGLLWILGNVYINNNTILFYITNSLDGFASYFGIDGVIFTAFIFSFPANELLFPTILMAYLSNNSLTEYSSLSDLSIILRNNGWTLLTAFCVLVLCIFHYPCSTTCFVIKRETKSTKALIASIIVPTLIGLSVTFVVNAIFSVLCH